MFTTRLLETFQLLLNLSRCMLGSLQFRDKLSQIILALDMRPLNLQFLPQLQ